MTHENRLSSTERTRQLEESIARAMERYRNDFEAVRENSARLRAAREALEAENASTHVASRTPIRKARRTAGTY
ncbi:hypothetical protein K9U40_04245 [Xanthobacter autotrophicus]|uniref:hypothetical protein n=1 Tax=Xanthobacter TaxID=279 RepID=UPI0024AA66E6|nr:hypothetical protein [Xanthobacter autotrophicus]MDI4663551.1 hypothetical protein [Xanthobacter autotrophicus]